ncbi:MAG: LysM peptidoglycan-binding domain-containing protein [Deltaproteobacteria bacterium]|nr:MAG: LysM peptidoglycan-binding domain-containing protein [Deltaproteobacteria bacterium]
MSMEQGLNPERFRGFCYVNMVMRENSSKSGLYLFVSLLAVFLFVQQQTLASEIPQGTQLVHWVLPGESLHRIALQYLPLTEELTVEDLIEKIRRLSGIDGSLIRPNQRLLIPSVRKNPVTAKTVPKEIDFQGKGIYINRYSMACQKMRRLADEIVSHGGNTVILDGKDMSGRLSYSSRVNLANEIGAAHNPPMGDLSKLIHYLHYKGLHVGVRLVLFYDPLLAEKKSDLALRSSVTGEPWMENGRVAWVDPAQPYVQRYNLDIAEELAKMGVDEIQFDYIRFPTSENIQYGTSGSSNEIIPRHKIITGFLAKARKELTDYKVLISIDVFGILAWGQQEDIQLTGQKIGDLARHCDVVSPMIYPSHFYGPFQGMANPATHPFTLVFETCRRFSGFLGKSKVTLRPWIQAFRLGANAFDQEYVLEQLRALSESEAQGWLLWNAGNAYGVAWDALAQWKDNTKTAKEKTVGTGPLAGN